MTATLPRDRLAPHLRPQIELRRARLFERSASFLDGARVLELAPNHCLFSEEILSQGASHLTLVEFDRTQGEIIRSFYAGNPRVSVMTEDAHTFLTTTGRSFDVVVCAGFLYHSPHPLWVLEGIARVNPEYVLLDTAVSRGPTPEVYPEVPNRPGFRQTGDGKDCGLSLRLPAAVYEEAMRNLGYRAHLPVDQTPADVTGLTPEQAGIVLGWSRTLSYWFRRQAG